MKCFIISNLEELNEAVKWEYIFLRSYNFQIQMDNMCLDEVKEWESLFNKEFKSNGNFEALIVALAFALLFALSLLIVHTRVIGTEIKILGMSIIVIGAILGKIIGLIQARMRLRYLAELLSEEVNQRKTNESFSEEELAMEFLELS